MTEQEVYLDFAASYPVKPQAIERLNELKDVLYNPSSSHAQGRKARVLKEQVRQFIAEQISVPSEHIIFTSGATEANAIVFHTAVHRFGVQRIITTALEHPSVADCVAHFAPQLEIIQLDLDENFRLDLEQLKALSSEAIPTMLSIMHVNNEVGLKFPIEELAQIAREHDHLWFHSDTVQTIGTTPFAVPEGVDFCTLSGHKFGAFHGVGALITPHSTQLYALQYGGGQERGHRAGTEALESILTLQAAWVENLADNEQHLQQIKAYAVSKLSEVLGNKVSFNVNSHLDEFASPKILSVAFDTPMMSEDIHFQLDRKGIAVSIGSACSSGHETESKVLATLMGHDVKPSLRVSFGTRTTTQDIDHFVAALGEIL